VPWNEVRVSLTTTLDRRVSIVDYRGQVLLDTYVQPTMPVADYRTAITGIEAKSLTGGGS